jgi:transcriptional regulator NrdR family protein
MRCPNCENDYTKVKETRTVEEWPRWTKRRRVCLECDTQFWSVEMPMEDLDQLQGEEDGELRLVS